MAGSRRQSPEENHVGSHTVHYDSMLVLAHFKGHPMGGYGGALKQLAIAAPVPEQGADSQRRKDR